MGPRPLTEVIVSALEAANAVVAIIKRTDKTNDLKLALSSEVFIALSRETTDLTFLLKHCSAVLADQDQSKWSEKIQNNISGLLGHTEMLLLWLFPTLENYQAVSQREFDTIDTARIRWLEDRHLIGHIRRDLRECIVSLCTVLSTAISRPTPRTRLELENIMAKLATPIMYEESASSVGNTSLYVTAPSSLSLSIKPVLRGLDGSFNAFVVTDNNMSPHRPADGDIRRTQTPHTTNEEYTRLLVEKSLILGPEQELNWSGRGQHVEFEPPDEPPLTVIGPLGVSMQARIDKVRCRRIVLARKTMKTNRKWTLEHAINEVEHLNGLRHAHIVQLVGSYLMRKDFAILLYPVADCNLTEFMTHWSLGPSTHMRATEGSINRQISLMKFFSCLAHALHFVHTKVTRHADIKPANILVKTGEGEWWQKYHLYLADFGISKSFVTQDQSQTESTEGRTLRYCAPEVYNDEPHGRAADIFSLGCVYSEMATVLAGKDLDDFSDFRRSKSETDYYHAHVEQTRAWLDQTVEEALKFQIHFGNSALQNINLGDEEIAPTEWTATFKSMLDPNPRLRPTASQLILKLGSVGCCDAGPEAYVADPSLTD